MQNLISYSVLIHWTKKERLNESTLQALANKISSLVGYDNELLFTLLQKLNLPSLQGQ